MLHRRRDVAVRSERIRSVRNASARLGEGGQVGASMKMERLPVSWRVGMTTLPGSTASFSRGIRRRRNGLFPLHERRQEIHLLEFLYQSDEVVLQGL